MCIIWSIFRTLNTLINWPVLFYEKPVKEKKVLQRVKKFRLKNDFFNASILYATVDGDHQQAYENLQYGQKCGISNKLQRENIKYVAQFLFDS